FKEGLIFRVGDQSDKAFVYNAYAVLMACRILYSTYHRTLVSKDQAYSWAMERVSVMLRAVVQNAKENRLKNCGLIIMQLEQDAMGFVEFVTAEVKQELRRLSFD